MKRFSQGPWLQKQKGAVAIIVALCSIVLFAFMGIALDLARTYNAKAELQNAADAAALAGAKELNQTKAGVTAAINKAIEMAKQHDYAYTKPVSNSSGSNLTLKIGECPNDSCMVLANTVTSDALAAGKTFLKVETGLRSLNTYFMRIAGAAFDTTETFGMAVAGRFVNNVAPIGVCAVDPTNMSFTSPAGELVEFGFRRGVAYNIPELNPLGAQGTPYLLNPVDSPPAGCQPSHSSANFTAPFICSGRSAIVTATPAEVYVNTGGSYGKIEQALNSRFDDFGGGSPCDIGSAPPDANIKEYKCTGAPGTNPGCVNNPVAGSPKDWMEPDPARETVKIEPVVDTDGVTRNKPNPSSFSDYGVLWTYNQAKKADVSASPFSTGDWGALYGAGNATSYPTPSPYAQESGSFFSAPSHVGTRSRRVLNVAIIDCRTLGGGGLSCAKIDVLGVGKFFMLQRADLTGTPKRIETEFAGLIEPVPTSEIKLYR